MSITPRSMLFVSGETPARFAKAVDAGADLVCLDLEDAVGADNKVTARESVIEFVGKNPSPGRLAIRINALGTADSLDDLRALCHADMLPDVLLVPKVEHARDLQIIQQLLQRRCPELVALIESPQGLVRLADIARAREQIKPFMALMLGGADLCAELGAEFEWDSLLQARTSLLSVARAFDLQAWDVPHLDVHNQTALATETHAIIRLGFDCKSAIHPAQLAVIHQAFEPDQKSIDWASGVLEAARSHGAGGADPGGAFLYQGRMIDGPILRRARQILNRSNSQSVSSTPQSSAAGKTNAH